MCELAVSLLSCNLFSHPLALWFWVSQHSDDRVAHPLLTNIDNGHMVTFNCKGCTHATEAGIVGAMGVGFPSVPVPGPPPLSHTPRLPLGPSSSRNISSFHSTICSSPHFTRPPPHVDCQLLTLVTVTSCAPCRIRRDEHRSREGTKQRGQEMECTHRNQPPS